MEDAYYRDLIFELKGKLDRSVEIAEFNKCMAKLAEVEFLLLKEKTEAERLEKLVAESTSMIEGAKREAWRWKFGLVMFMVAILPFISGFQII